MRQLETEMDNVAKENGLQTKILNREDEPDKYVKSYLLGFQKSVKPADFFRLEIAINEYFDRAVKLLPKDAEKETASRAYLKSAPIQAGPGRAGGFMGITLEPAVPESHKRYSAVITALENVIVAAESCIRRYK